MRKTKNINTALLPGRNDGFTLVELLIVMALFVVVLAASANTFTLILKQSTQQVKQSETQMERIVGLELLRTDIGTAGFGLPWSFRNSGISYEEAVPNNVCGGNSSSGTDPSTYNDATSGVPRAVFSDYGVCINGSDYLVVKSTSVAASSSSQDWSYINYGSNAPRAWGTNDIPNGDNVTVIEPQESSSNIRQLVMNNSSFSTTYSNNAFDPNFTPFNSGEVFLIYDVDPNYALRMPFNRADYYISTSSVPQSCAPNTGVLVKATVSHKDGSMTNNLLPLLDCVADMKVIYVLNFPFYPSYTTATSGKTADELRNQIVEIRVYILSHEGGKDISYNYPNPSITIDEFGLTSAFNLPSVIGPGWQNYRWKVSTIAVTPQNLQ